MGSVEGSESSLAASFTNINADFVQVILYPGSNLNSSNVDNKYEIEF